MQSSFAEKSVATLGALALFALSALLLLAAILASSGGWRFPSPVVGNSQFAGQPAPDVRDGEFAGQPDVDIAPLAQKAEQATQRVAEVASDAVLRQIDISATDGRIIFRFVGSARTQEIDVVVSSPAALPSQWTIGPGHVSSLTNGTRPGIDLAMLRIGPGTVAHAITDRWSDCSPQFLTLSDQRGSLTWYASCVLPDGRGTMVTVDGRTGAFSGAYPGPVPAIPPSISVPPSHVPAGAPPTATVLR